MALSDKAYSAAVMAEYRRGQAQGDIYVSKSEIRHGTIESMSKEEVMKALKEIKEQYEPVTYSVGGQSEEDDEKTQRKKTRERILEVLPEPSEEAPAELAAD